MLTALIGSIRLLPLSAGAAAWNMAVDEALLEAGDQAGPTLRFYEWDEEAVSLGIAQRSADDLRLDRIRQRGISVVRRPSGGTTIYHQHQMAVALVLANDHRLNSPDITESYKSFAELLAQALASLGIEAEVISPLEARQKQSAAPISRCCLAGANPYEPFVNGRKAAGLAQVRRRNRSLIHAVIPLQFDPLAWAHLLQTDPLSEEQFAEKLSTLVFGLDQLAGRPITSDEVCQAIVTTVQAAGYEFVPAELSETERQLAEQLYRERYSQPAWTYRL